MQNRRLGDMPMSPRFEQREQASPARMQALEQRYNIFISFPFVIAFYPDIRGHRHRRAGCRHRPHVSSGRQQCAL